jgi:prefoldin subunit 5
MATTPESTPPAVAAAVQSLAAEAVTLQARITELRHNLALLDRQMRSVSHALQRLRAVDAEQVSPSPHPSPAT